MNYLLKISQQTFWQLLGKAVTSLSTIIILGLITRNYGEAGTGIFTLAVTYLAIFHLLADFGFNAHILKSLKDGEWQKLLGVRIIWSLILISLSITLLPFLSFVTFDFSRAVLLGSLSIVGFAIFTTSNLIFQRQHQYNLSTVASGIGILFGLGLYFWLASLSLGVSWLLVATSLSWILAAIVSLFFIKKFLANIAPIFDFEYTKKLLLETWPIAATLALNVVYFRVDSFLVTFYKGISEAGVYNVAYSIFQTGLVLPTFIMNAYYPLLLKSSSKVKLIGLVLLILSMGGMILTILLASLMINILTGGQGFMGASKSLQILSLGFPAFFISSLLMWLVIKKGNYRKMLVIYFLGLLVNLILNFLFIPQFSYIAASWITVISEYLILILLLVSL